MQSQYEVFQALLENRLASTAQPLDQLSLNNLFFDEPLPEPEPEPEPEPLLPPGYDFSSDEESDYHQNEFREIQHFPEENNFLPNRLADGEVLDFIDENDFQSDEEADYHEVDFFFHFLQNKPRYANINL
jgi:hypothetical protein